MSRYAFLAAPSAVADAPKAAAKTVVAFLAAASPATAFTAAAPLAAATSVAPAPLGGARS
ncbi:hypothetical protein [Streptomyces sp. NPDC001770]